MTPLPKQIGKPATRALESIGITSIEDLAKISENELAGLHGVGPKAVGILRSALKEKNLSLREL